MFHDFLLIDDFMKEDCEIWMANEEINLNYNVAKSIFMKNINKFLEVLEFEEAIKNEIEIDEDESKNELFCFSVELFLIISFKRKILEEICNWDEKIVRSMCNINI